MAEFTPILTGGDAHNIIAQVIVTDPSGIRKLVYRDNFGMELGSEIFQCEPRVVGNIGTIPIDRLPFFVVLTNCTDNVVNSLPLFAFPTTAMPNPAVPLPCSPLFCPPNAPCDAAQARVRNGRFRVDQLCPDFREARRDRDRNRMSMIILYAIAIVLAIAGALSIAFGGYIGLIIGVFLLVVAGIALGAALASTFSFNEANRVFLEIEGRMNSALNEFNQGANDARINCCPHCITDDLTPPTCEFI